MRLLLVAVLATVLAACQVRVTTDVEVDPDGGGEAVVTIVADDELWDALVDAGLDPRSGIDEAAAGADWSVRPVDRPDATGVELSTTFTDPGELGERVDALTAGLGADDGALLRGVSLSRTEDGGYAFEADAGLDPPRILGTLPLPSPPTAGAEGDEPPPVFDGDALGELLAREGDRYAVAELRLRLPTVPEAPGAVVEGTSATWSLPVDGLAPVSASAPPVPVQSTTAVVVAAVAGGLLVVAFAVRATRRRR